MQTIWFCRSPANSMQKKFKPTFEPCQDTERVSLHWHGCYFPGTGSELVAAHISSVVIFLELSIVLLFFFFLANRKTCDVI